VALSVGDKVVATSDGYHRSFDDRGKRGFDIGAPEKIWSKGQKGEVVSVHEDYARIEFSYPGDKVLYYNLRAEQYKEV
jgi:hypothetical protein